MRNRLKINAIITNAQAYLAMIQSGDDFSQFILFGNLSMVKLKLIIGNIRMKYLLIRIFLITFHVL